MAKYPVYLLLIQLALERAAGPPVPPLPPLAGEEASGRG